MQQQPPRSPLALFALLALSLLPLRAEARRDVVAQRAHAPHGAARAAMGRTAQGTCTTGPGLMLAPVAQPHLDYCGGRVLSHAQLVAVLWGPPDPLVVTATCKTSFQDCLDDYYAKLVASPQFDWLDEYQTTVPALDGTAGTGQHIGRPTYYGSVVITPSNTNAVIGEVDTENELIAQIQAGHLPPPNAADETIYEVHFPLTVDPSDPANCSEACRDYCAYHDSWRSNILGTTGLLAIIPSHMPPGYTGRDCSACGEKTDWFANLGGSISHETFEAITDPDVGLASSGDCHAPLGWYDQSGFDSMSVHAEIGDMCEGIPDWPSGQRASDITEITLPAADGGVFTVQREWSNAYSSCIGSADDAFHLSGPAGTSLAVVGGSTPVVLSTSAPFDAGAPLPIKFTTHGLPSSGVSAAYAPSIIDASAQTTLTFSIAADATQTGFPFGVAAETGSSQAQAVLAIAAPEFAASLSSQATITLTAGGAPASETLNSAVTTGVPRGFTVAAAGIPGVSLSPDAGTLGAPLTLSIGAAAGTPSSSGTLAVDVASAGVVHAIPLQLIVQGDDVALTAPAGQSVRVGGSTTFALATSTKAGNPQPLALSTQNLPAGATVTFAPRAITSGQSAQVTLSVSDSQAQQPFNITVVAAGPVASTTVNVPFTVLEKSGCAETSGIAWAALGLIALAARRRGAQAA